MGGVVDSWISCHLSLWNAAEIWLYVGNLSVWVVPSRLVWAFEFHGLNGFDIWVPPCGVFVLVYVLFHCVGLSLG